MKYMLDAMKKAGWYVGIATNSVQCSEIQLEKL